MFLAYHSFDGNTDCKFIVLASENLMLIFRCENLKKRSKDGVTKINGNCKAFILLTLFSLVYTHRI